MTRTMYLTKTKQKNRRTKKMGNRLKKFFLTQRKNKIDTVHVENGTGKFLVTFSFLFLKSNLDYEPEGAVLTYFPALG